MTRTILIGDVHGCADELSELLEKVCHTTTDRVIFVGDLVVRGPKPNEVLTLARELDAASVMGNHEHRLLRFRAVQARSGKKSRPQPEDPDRKLLRSKMLRRTAAALDRPAWRYLDAMPLWLEVPEHRLLVVHAALEPGLPVTQQTTQTLLYARTLDASGAPSIHRDAGVLWGARYAGPPQVVFGHNAMHVPQLHPWATGIDTGCVYGGRLTALVLPAGSSVPAVADRGDALVSVPARETYVPIEA